MKHFLKRLMLTSCFAFTTMTMAANVAKIGDTEYATIDAAIAAWKTGDVIELLTDIERNGYFVFTQSTFTIDGKGHTIKCTAAHSKYWRYFVNANGSSGTAIQTFRNVTIDANGKVPYVMQSIDGGKLILENVTLKGGKTTTVGSWLSRNTALGYGIHINDGSVEATDLTVSDCEVSDVYLDGNSSSFTLAGDKCNLDVVGSSGAGETVVSTAKGYYAYEVTYDGNIKDGVTKTISNRSWNGIIDQVQQAATAIVATFPVTVKINSVSIKLLQDVVLSEKFTSNDTRLTIDGNGKTVTGEIKFTSPLSKMSNIVLGDGTVLDFPDSTPTDFENVSVASGATIVVSGEKMTSEDFLKIVSLSDAATVVFEKNNTVCTNNGASTITLPASTTDYSTKAKAQLAKAAAEMGITTITAVEKPSAIDIEGLELFENVLSFNRTATTRSSSEETATAVVDYAFGITSIGLNVTTGTTGTGEDAVTITKYYPVVTAKVSKLDKTEGPTFAEGVTVKLYQVVTTTDAETGTTTTSLEEIPSTATKVDGSTITVTSKASILGDLGNAPSLTKPLTIKAVK